MTENPPLFRRKEGDSSFDRVFSDVVHVDLQFLKGFGEFLFALGHVEGDPEALVWVVGGGGEDFAEGLGKEGVNVWTEHNALGICYDMDGYGEIMGREFVSVNGHLRGAVLMVGGSNCSVGDKS